MHASSSFQYRSIWRAFATIFVVVSFMAGCADSGGVGSGGTGTGSINASNGAGSGSTSDTTPSNSTNNANLGAYVQSSLARIITPQVPDADMTAVIAGNTAFALKAFTLLDPDGGTNTVFSPYSITQAIALTAAGAGGTTLSQIEQALAFPLSQDRLNPAFNKLDLQLKAKTSGTVQDTTGQLPNLNIVNALWGQQGFPFLSAYLDTIALNFGAGLRLVDFINATDASRQTINGWVADQTNQRITDLIPQGAIDTTTRMVLTNAIRFKANWASQFAEISTQNKPFNNRNGFSSQVPFMRGTFSLLYAQDNGCQAVDIPYVGEKLSMLVIMPDTGTFDTFLTGLTPASLNEIVNRLAYPTTSFDTTPVVVSKRTPLVIQAVQDIDLSLPKFTFSATPDIGSVLDTLGMADAFDKNKANFLGIDGGVNGVNDLYIGKVLHKAFISVDEKGTEAAAATAVAISTITSVILRPPPLPLVIDRPFIFLIRDRNTGLILFMGKVVAL